VGEEKKINGVELWISIERQQFVLNGEWRKWGTLWSAVVENRKQRNIGQIK